MTTEVDPLGRQNFLARLQAKAEADPRIRALWLEGSLGRGNADQFSDVDVHVLLGEADALAFKSEAEGWLNDVRPLVLCKLLFGGNMVNGLTVDGLRLDLWPHAGDTISLDPAKVKVLHQLDGAVQLVAAAEAPAQSGPQALALLQEFWRCISLLPSVIGRRERLVAVQGLAVELSLVSELLLLGAGVVRDRGVKHLNAYLPEADRRALEANILPTALSEEALAAAHLRLARLVQQRGPKIAAQHGVDYPTALERVVLETVHAQLAALGIEFPDGLNLT